MTITFSQLGSQGRMSNQFFRLSASIALAIRNDDDYLFPPWQYEPYFNLHNCFSPNIKPTTKYQEPYFHYRQIPLTNTQNQMVDLSGFFQSEKYFADCRDVIRSLFTPVMYSGIKYGHTSLHIRRGDYVNMPREYVQLEMNYYEKAMKMIGSKHYIVFSDDIEWCKKHFSGDNVEFSEGRSAVEDICLMMECENNIVANSSYSWWAAWLNKNPSKQIVAPKNWFGEALPHDTKDLIPTNWETI